MSILIKGMEMPKSCYGCQIKSWDNMTDELICPFDLTSIPYNGKKRNCPLIEIPPHGRLIDADALTKDLDNRWNVNDDQDFCNKEVWRGIEDAPTIIPAEEGE